jgi:FimV-like protein
MNHYLIILAPMSILLLAIPLIVIYQHKKNKNKLPSNEPQPKKTPKLVITSQDIRAIAGEDVIATQLDLARAYIEIGKKQLARKILDHTLKQGTLLQQQEARRLLTGLGF